MNPIHVLILVAVVVIAIATLISFTRRPTSMLSRYDSMSEEELSNELDMKLSRRCSR